METILISLLLLAIGLLLFLLGKSGKDNPESSITSKTINELPDIIGKPKPAGSQLIPTVANNNQNDKLTEEVNNFDPITEAKSSEIPQEGLEQPDKAIPDWKEEEEELEGYAGYSDSDGLATGVTFDELATVGRLLERKALEPSEKDIAVSMISRINGTELLGLLESRVGDASKKIAMLLDVELTRRGKAGSS